MAAAREKTFDQCRDEFIARHQREWTNVKHAAQWRSSLTRYVTPVFGKLSVQAVNRAALIRALDSLWQTKAETADRVRGRVERILDFAEARGYRREGSNPARRGAARSRRHSDLRRSASSIMLPWPMRKCRNS
jgi:hypothetical protein